MFALSYKFHIYSATIRELLSYYIIVIVYHFHGKLYKINIGYKLMFES